MLLVVGNQPNAPLDLVELLGWGNAWQLGYPKHPPLPCWIAAAFGRLSPGEVWGVYLAGYLTSTLCLWSVWQVGRLYLPPRLAFLATVSLDGLNYLGADAAEWNNNVALNLGWALIAWMGFKAVHTGSLRWWFATGVSAGIALLCKYTALVHLAPLAAYLVLSPRGRRHLSGPGPYVAAAVSLAMFLPHVAWLAEHDFVTLKFVAGRIAETGGWVKHFRNPAVFLGTQALLWLPVLFVIAPVLGRRSAPRNDTDMDPWLLRAAAVGPLALFTLYGAITGCMMRDIWGATFLSYLGVWLLMEFGRADDAAATRAFRRWAVVVAIVAIVFVVRVRMMPHLDAKQDRQHFPGRPLADEVQRRWSERFETPYGVVAGEAWAAANIASYSPHRPTMFTDWSVGYLMFDSKKSPWTGDDDMRTRGGVIVWDAVQLGDDIPAVVRARFPEAVAEAPVVLPYQSTAPIPPARIGLALIPPNR
jgi:hypothetical protein